MNIYLKVVFGDWHNASRDKRELNAVKKLGFEPLVLASTKESKEIFSDIVSGFNVIRIPTRYFGVGKIKTYLGYIYALIIYLLKIREIDAQIISGHNYEALLLSYIAQIGKSKRAKLVYDCHEFELYKTVHRNKFQFYCVKFIENFLLKRADINMMVTDPIADSVKKIYSLEERPLVVRNIPVKSLIHPDIVKKNRREFMEHLSIDDNGFIIMHHGGLSVGRGIEEAIKATSQMNNVGLVIMGYALNDMYRQSLVDLVDMLNVKERVYFKDAVPFEKLYDYVAAVDAGIVLIQHTSMSFYYSLPNKLFENIQAMTPVIGSDFPGIGGIISKYDVGIKIKPNSLDELVNAIKVLMNDKSVYKRYKENTAKAREVLCWQNEEKILISAIKNIL